MPKHNDTDLLIEFAKFLSCEAAKVTLQYFRTAVEIDSKPSHDWDPVTDADRKAEGIIRHHIESRFPDHGILGEEHGIKIGSSGYQWILDPIDGTRAFVTGMPTWAILVGLYYEGNPLIGVMNQPFLNEIFVGSDTGSVYERAGISQPLKVSNVQQLGLAKVGTTSPHLYAVHGCPDEFDRLRNAVRLIRYGGDAYFFGMLASGHLDLALDPMLQAYDIAALIPIIRGAGGVVKEWKGGNPAKGGNILAACTESLAEHAIEILNGHNSPQSSR